MNNKSITSLTKFFFVSIALTVLTNFSLSAEEITYTRLRVTLLIPSAVTKNGNLYQMLIDKDQEQPENSYIITEDNLQLKTDGKTIKPEFVQKAFNLLTGYCKKKGLPYTDQSKISHLMTHVPADNETPRQIVSWWFSPCMNVRGEPLDSGDYKVIGNEKAGATGNKQIDDNNKSFFNVSSGITFHPTKSGEITSPILRILFPNETLDKLSNKITIYHFFFSPDGNVALEKEEWKDIKYPHDPNRPFPSDESLKKLGLGKEAISPIHIDTPFSHPFINTTKDITKQGNFAIACYWSAPSIKKKSSKTFTSINAYNDEPEKTFLSYEVITQEGKGSSFTDEAKAAGSKYQAEEANRLLKPFADALGQILHTT